MKKRMQPQLDGKNKRTKSIEEECSGPIVYFVSKHNCLSISRQSVVRDQIPPGWIITKRRFIDTSTIFNPNDYEGFSRKNMETFHVKDEVTFKNVETTLGVLMPRFNDTSCDCTFLSIPRPYSHDVFVINWGQVVMQMMGCISQATLIGCNDILFLIALYASPLCVFVSKDPTKRENSDWFLGENDCLGRVRDLLDSGEKTQEYFDFLGIENIAEIAKQDSQDQVFLQCSKSEQFELFVKMLDTKQWVSYWLEAHFYLP